MNVGRARTVAMQFTLYEHICGRSALSHFFRDAKAASLIFAFEIGIAIVSRNARNEVEGFTFAPARAPVASFDKQLRRSTYKSPAKPRVH